MAEKEECERRCGKPKMCDHYCAEHHRQWCARSLKPRTYTFSEVERTHLLTLLNERDESGEYYGQRERYYARTKRLIEMLSDSGGEHQREVLSEGKRRHRPIQAAIGVERRRLKEPCTRGNRNRRLARSAYRRTAKGRN